MKDHIQTILNVCFAICITAFIYQNNSLKDDVETLKDVNENKFYEEIWRNDIQAEVDSIEVQLETHIENLEILYNNWDRQDKYNETLRDVIDNNGSQLKDVTNNQNKLIDAVATIQEWLEQNFGE